MKLKMFLVVILVLITVDQCLAVPLTDSTNKHNLSSNATNSIHALSETRICVFCHTPHGASAQSALWNRKNPSTASFPLYSSPTLNIADAAIVGESQYTNADPAAYPNGATRMCLSCHDGVSAIGEILSSASPLIMNTNTLASSAAVVDLATTHPVSFVYNDAVRSYLNTTTGGGLDGRTDYVAPTAVPLDGQQRLQCTTCHDPHEDTRTVSYNLPFWRNYTGTETADYDNTCNDCHQGTDWGTTVHSLP